MQADIRNAESDAIRHLYSQIDAGSFKFNYLESVVQAESNYVIRGGDYNAEVFIAARDTTQQPIIYLGDYDSTISDEGMVDYLMKGELGRDYDSLPVRGGRGVYSLTPSSTGPKSYRGIISLKRMDGSFTNKPFHGQYMVAPPSLIVSATKMNVFYQSLENPIDVSAPGTTQENISITLSNGTYTGSNGSYIVSPNRLEECIVSAYDVAGGSRRKLGDAKFRVEAPPPPQASLAGKQFGTVTRNDLQRALGIEVSMPDWFKFEIEYKITGMTFINRVGVNIQRMNATNGDFTSEIRNAINLMPSGQYLQFENIKAVGPDGKVQELPILSIMKR